MPAGEPSLQVEFVAGVRELDQELWRECFPAPLEGRFWYETLEKSGLEDQFTFRYALLRLAGRPVGIAPCFTHDVPISLVAPKPVAFAFELLSGLFPRANYQRTFFVGSPCSDEGTIGLVPGIALAEVLPGLVRAVRQEARKHKAPVIAFKDFRQADLEALGREKGFFPIVSYPGTVLPLPPPDKEAYLRSLSHLRRHNFLKKLRRSKEELRLRTTIAARPSDAELGEIFGLFWQTYRKGKTKFERLGPKFFEAVSDKGEARFILQRDAAGGELLAFMLVFHLG